jgi:hypothetical protein
MICPMFEYTGNRKRDAGDLHYVGLIRAAAMAVKQVDMEREELA